MGMRVLGLIKARSAFTRMEREMKKGAEDSVDGAIDELKKESGIQIPKKTNALVGTQQVVVHSDSGSRVSKGVKYGEPGEGDGVIDYAAAVHEILKASHAPPTKAKFMEDPLFQGIPQNKRIGKAAMKEAVRRAFR